MLQATVFCKAQTSGRQRVKGRLDSFNFYVSYSVVPGDIEQAAMDTDASVTCNCLWLKLEEH